MQSFTIVAGDLLGPLFLFWTLGVDHRLNKASLVILLVFFWLRFSRVAIVSTSIHRDFLLLVFPSLTLIFRLIDLLILTFVCLSYFLRLDLLSLSIYSVLLSITNSLNLSFLLL